MHRALPAKPFGERGATAAEYALMVSLIAMAIIGSVLLFGKDVAVLFSVPPGYF